MYSVAATEKASSSAKWYSSAVAVIIIFPPYAPSWLLSTLLINKGNKKLFMKQIIGTRRRDCKMAAILERKQSSKKHFD